MLIRFEVPAHDQGIYFESRDISCIAWSSDEKMTYIITYQGRLCPVLGTTREAATRLRDAELGLEDRDDDSAD